MKKTIILIGLLATLIVVGGCVSGDYIVEREFDDRGGITIAGVSKKTNSLRTSQLITICKEGAKEQGMDLDDCKNWKTSKKAVLNKVTVGCTCLDKA